MWDKKLFKNIDYYLLISVLLLVVIGLVMIYSATRNNYALTGGDPFALVKKQALAVAMGIAGMILIMLSDYRFPDLIFHILYGLNLLLLLLVLSPLGMEVKGAKSWLNLGGAFSLQPSELAKLLVILTLAKHLADKEEIDSFWDLWSPFIHIFFPLVLILLQPDLGTTLVFMFFFFVMLYVAGYSRRFLLGVILAGISALVLLFVSHYYLGTPLPFKEYQIQRMTIFLNPDRDPTGSGWNVRQAIIAVGSGRFMGKGLFQGTQGRLGFLPESHNDFIFAILCEELGFLGGFLVLALFFIIIWRCLVIMQQAKDKEGVLITAGITAMFLFHIMENIGMNIGIMPITGIPLPFVSYGGSAMITNLLAIGFIENIWLRRQKLLF
ncbi:MAG: rod shape-determining protein RodA [Firmicutes bacterium]|nr:rod shape-determining protein RodA [Bacillota bacterium]